MVCALGLLLLIGLPQTAVAQNYTWSGTNALWTSSNWVTSSGTTTFPGGTSSANTAIINSGTVTFAGNDTFGTDTTTSSPVIRIGSGGTLASGGKFNTLWNVNLNGGTLLANGGVNASYPAFQLAGTLTVDGTTASSISLGGGSNNQINIGGSGNGTLTVNVADVTSSTATDLTIATVLQNNARTSPSALTKSGSGTLVLTAANTYTGLTTISGGVLALSSAGSLVSTGTVAITGTAATFDISGANAGRTLGMLAGTAGSSVVLGANSLTLGDATSGTFAGGIGGTGGLTKQGAGTLALSGSSTFSGGVTLSAGQLNVNNADALGTGTFTISSGTIGNTSGGVITLATNNAQAWNGDFVFAGSNPLALGTGGVTLSANRQVTVTSSTLTVGGAISGAFSLTKAGAGTLTLSGANTYTGATSVNAGTLVIGAGGSIASTGNVNTTAGGLLSIAGSVTMAANTYFAVGNGILGTTGTTTIDGGLLAVGNNAFLIGGGRSEARNAGVGTFVVNSGTVTVGAGSASSGGQDATSVFFNPYALTGTSQLVLNGGVFSTARTITDGGGGRSILAFNGGTLQFGASIQATNTVGTIAVNSGGAVIDSNTFSGTFSQVLATGTGATAGGLTKIGSGTLTLSATNTFTGTTRINAGVLSITNASGIQSSTLDMNALDSGTITFAQTSTIGGLTGSRNLDMGTRALSFGNNNQSTTYSGTLSNGTFTKVGSGTLTLTATAATSVTTTVSGGVLALSGGNNRLGTSSAITLSGGTLDLGGNSQTTSANVTFSGNSGLTSGTLASTLGGGFTPTGTLTLGTNAAFFANLASQRFILQGSSFSLTGSAGSSLNYGGGTAGTANYVGVDSGGLATVTVNGPTVNFVIAAGEANATGGWLRIGANSGAVGVVNLQSGTINVGHSASLASRFDNGAAATASSGTLTITSGAFNVGTGTNTTTAGGANGYLYLNNDVAGSTGDAIVNLNGGLLSVKRIVPGTGGGTKQVNFNGGTLTAAASDASFMNAANGFTANVGNAGGTIDSGTFAITVSAPLLTSGAGGLTKQGAGTLTLTGSNTYLGATTVSSGTLEVGGAGLLGGGAYAGTIANAGALLFSTSANQTLSGGISGAGRLAKLGVGTLTLSGSNAFSGGIALSAGQLNVNAANALGTGTVTVAGGTIDNTSGSAVTLAGSLSQAWNADVAFAGSNALNLGTGTVTLSANRNVTVTANTLTVGGPIAGAFALTKLGSGTLALGAINTYSGSTTVSAGVLRLTGGTNPLSQTAAITLNGGTLDLGGNSQATSNAVAFSGNSGLTSGTLTATGGQSYTPTGTLTLGPNAAFFANQSGQRLLLGFGTTNNLTLTGSAGSSLTFGGNESNVSSFVGVDGGNGTLTVNGPTLNFRIADGGNTSGGWLRIGGNSGATGLVTLQSGTINVGQSASLGANFAGDPSAATTSSGTLTINGGAFVVGTGTLTTGSGGANGYLYLKTDNASSTGNAIVNLNGGLLSTKRIVSGTGGGTKQLNFNGGTLVAAASDTSFMNAAPGFSVNVGNAGGTIDTGTFAITVATPLLASGTGGITKVGAGTLTLGGANTYSGQTRISTGVLALGANGTFANSNEIKVGDAGSSGATLDLTAKTAAFALGAGQTLSGGGTVLVAPGQQFFVEGIFSPGNSPGLFTFDGGTTVLSGTTVMEIFGTSRATSPSHGSGFYDAVNIVDSGILQFGGVLSLEFSSLFDNDSVFDLFTPASGSSLAGDFTAVNVVGGFYTGLSWTQTGSVWKSSNTTAGQSLEFSSVTGQLVIVPEPEAIALAGLGVVIAGWAVARRRRAAS